MKKKLISMLLSISMLAVVFTGCGTTSEEEVPENTEAEVTDTADETENETEAEAGGGEITEINYWTWEAGD